MSERTAYRGWRIVLAICAVAMGVGVFLDALDTSAEFSSFDDWFDLVGAVLSGICAAVGWRRIMSL
jgi:hypothetical protein